MPVISLAVRMAEGTRTSLAVGELAAAALNTIGVAAAGAALAVLLALPVGILADHLFRLADAELTTTCEVTTATRPGAVFLPGFRGSRQVRLPQRRPRRSSSRTVR